MWDCCFICSSVDVSHVTCRCSTYTKLCRGSRSMDWRVVWNLSAFTPTVLYSAAGKHRRLFHVLRVQRSESKICRLFSTCFQRNHTGMYERWVFNPSLHYPWLMDVECSCIGRRVSWKTSKRQGIKRGSGRCQEIEEKFGKDVSQENQWMWSCGCETAQENSRCFKQILETEFLE